MKNVRTAYLITAVVALFGALFLPLYPAPEWIMAETGTTLGFYNAAHLLFSVSDPLNYWIVAFTLSIFVPSLALFVCAIIGKQVPFLLASLAAVTLWAVVVWRYIGQFGFPRLVAFDGTGVGIGVWVALIVFLAAVVFGIIGNPRHG